MRHDALIPENSCSGLHRQMRCFVAIEACAPTRCINSRGMQSSCCARPRGRTAAAFVVIPYVASRITPGVASPIPFTSAKTSSGSRPSKMDPDPPFWVSPEASPYHVAQVPSDIDCRIREAGCYPVAVHSKRHCHLHDRPVARSLESSGALLPYTSTLCVKHGMLPLCSRKSWAGS